MKGRGSRVKSVVLALASTTVALLIGIWVTAYLTVWPPAMTSVRVSPSSVTVAFADQWPASCLA